MVIVLNCVVVEVVDAFVDRCLVKTYQEKGKKDGYGYRVENVLGYHISAFMVEIVIPISWLDVVFVTVKMERPGVKNAPETTDSGIGRGNSHCNNLLLT